MLGTWGKVYSTCVGLGKSYHFYYLTMLRCVWFFFSLSFRAWCGVGGNDHPVARQCPLRLLVCDHPQRSTVCGVDLPPSQAGMWPSASAHPHSIFLCLLHHDLTPTLQFISYLDPRTYIHVRTHLCAHMRTHKHAYSHMYSHINAHTHTHTLNPIALSCSVHGLSPSPPPALCVPSWS